jgi:MFS family permease
VEATRRSPLLVIFLTVFIDLLGFGIVLPLLPRYAKALDAGPVTLGLLMSSFSAMQFLFSPVWGRLSDRIGRRPVLCIGLISTSVFYALFGIATLLRSLPLLFVSRIGAGIAGATIATAQAFIADSTSEQDRGKGMALVGAAFGAGFTFGPLVGSFWVSNDPTLGPSPAPGYTAAALSFAAFLFAVIVLPESRIPGSARAETGWTHWLHAKSIRNVIGSHVMGILVLTFFVSTFAFGNFESTLALLTRSEGFSFGDRGNFYLFAYIGFVLSLAQGFLVRRLMPVFGEIKMANAGAILMAVGLAGVGVAALSGTSRFLLLVLPVVIVGFACLTPSLQSLISRQASSAIQGETLGLVQSTASLARILAPVCGNVLFGRVSPPAPYFFGAAVMGLAFLLSMAAGRLK